MSALSAVCFIVLRGGGKTHYKMITKKENQYITMYSLKNKKKSKSRQLKVNG